MTRRNLPDDLRHRRAVPLGALALLLLPELLVALLVAPLDLGWVALLAVEAVWSWPGLRSHWWYDGQRPWSRTSSAHCVGS